MESITNDIELVKVSPGKFRVEHLTGLSRDPSRGEIIARNGKEIGRFPDTPEGLKQAQWVAIKNDNPRVYKMAKVMNEENNSPGYETRVLQAARNICKGEIPQLTRREIIGYHCLCDDYTQGRDRRLWSEGDHAPTIRGQTYCSCVLTVILLERMGSLVETVADQKEQVRAELGSIMGFQGHKARYEFKGRYYG